MGFQSPHGLFYDTPDLNIPTIKNKGGCVGNAKGCVILKIPFFIFGQSDNLKVFVIII